MKSLQLSMNSFITMKPVKLRKCLNLQVINDKSYKTSITSLIVFFNHISASESYQDDDPLNKYFCLLCLNLDTVRIAIHWSIDFQQIYYIIIVFKSKNKLFINRYIVTNIFQTYSKNMLTIESKLILLSHFSNNY